MKVLVIEAPYERERRVPWNEEAAAQYSLMPWHVRILEEGEIVWRGDTAFTLEDE